MTRVARVLDVEKLIKDLEGLIIWAANKYFAGGHAILSKDDLIAEGWLVFAKILDHHPDVSEKRFKLIFNASLFNHMRSLLSKHRYTQKKGYDEENGINYDECFIDLSDIAETVGVETMFDIYYKEYVEHVRQILVAYPDAIEVFNELVEPSVEVCQLAINEVKRKTHIQKQGYLVRGVDIVRIKLTHIQKYLGWSSERVGRVMPIIKETVLSVVGNRRPIAV